MAVGAPHCGYCWLSLVTHRPHLGVTAPARATPGHGVGLLLGQGGQGGLVTSAGGRGMGALV